MVEILSRVIKEGLVEKLVFKKKIEEAKVVSLEDRNKR